MRGTDTEELHLIPRRCPFLVPGRCQALSARPCLPQRHRHWEHTTSRPANGYPLRRALAATLKPNIYASGIVTFAVASLAVLLRFGARRLKQLNWWYDDWFIVAALVPDTFFLGLHPEAPSTERTLLGICRRLSDRDGGL